MPDRPHAVAFDVLETLLDLRPLRARFEAVGQPGDLLHPWFLRLQRDAMALALSGTFRGFRPVARQALRTECNHTASDDDIEHILSGFVELPAHPDAEPALRRLTEAGVRVGCLTVGSPEATARFLELTRLDRHVERTVTAEQAQAWKPAPALYRSAADEFDVEPARLALVAVHAWDCHGAQRAGCLTGWCSRLEGHHGDVFSTPDITGDDLVQVADRLLELPLNS